MPQLLTVAEVLTRLNLSKPDSIRAAIKAGELRAIDVGTGRLRTIAGKVRPTWRISEADLADWIDRRAARPTPAAPRSRRRKVSKPETQYV